MRNGAWYTRPQLRRLVAEVMGYDGLKGTLVRVWRYGWVERRRGNLDLRPGGEAWNACRPRDAFRITAAGLAELAAEDGTAPAALFELELW